MKQHWIVSIRKNSRLLPFAFILLVLLAFSAGMNAQASGNTQEIRIPIYTENQSPSNHFVPSNYMDGAVWPKALSVNENWTTQPFNGQTSIRVDYQHPAGSGYYGGGLYWAEPANNWGNQAGGWNLTGVKSFSFAIRSDQPGQVVYIVIGGIGYQQRDGNLDCSKPIQPYPDSVCPTIKLTLTLPAEWTVYYIDLTGENVRDFQKVVGGFGFWSAQSVTLYLDDMMYHIPLDYVYYLPVVTQ